MTHQLIESIKLTAASKKLFSEATKRRNELLQLATDLEPDRHNRNSKMHELADQAVAAFWAAPSRELAEKAHDALVRNRDAEVSFTSLNQGIHKNLPAAARIAEAAALQVVDDAIAELDRQHEAAIQGAPKGGLFATRANLDNQHATALQELMGERNSLAAGGDPLHWLECHGFTAD